MKRRSFLKLLGFSATVPAIASAKDVTTALREPPVMPAVDAVVIGKIRECWQYNISTDEIFVRYDILIGGEQLHVDTLLPPKPTDADFDNRRGVAREVLGTELRHRSKTWADAKAPPLPIGGAMARYV